MEEQGPAQPNYLQYLAVLRRRWFPAAFAFSSVLGATILYITLKAPVYRVQGQVLYSQDDKSAASLLGLDSATQGIIGKGDADRKLETELNVILSQPLLQRTLGLLQNSYPQKEWPDLKELKENIAVKNVVNTDIIQIYYDSTDSQLAALLVNQLMQDYLENNVQTTRATSIAAREFITAQLPEVRRNVYRADVALRQFKERYRLTNLEVSTTSNAENLARLDEQIDQAETQLTSLNSDFRNLQQKLGLNGTEALAVSTASQSTAVQSSLAEVQALAQQLSSAQAQYQDDFPLVQDLKAKLAQARALLQANVATALQGQGSPRTNQTQVGPTQQELLNTLIKTEISRNGLGQQLETLNQQRTAYLNQAKVLPVLEQRQRELERELTAAESTYQALLKSLQDVRVTENQTVGNVRVIEPAQIPEDPIAPNKKAAIAAGTLAGILLAVALVYLLESLDTRVKRVEEARDLFEYTLLGTIPSFPPLPERTEMASLPVLREPRSNVSEAYRVLQANVKFLQSDLPLKVITITSSVAQEGKSTTSANLAAALHQMGHTVLLVDLDLRRPSQHQAWEISNVAGASDFLAGQIHDISSVTRIIEQGLEVVTAGTLPPNPLALLDSVRMAAAIKDWSTQYDYVILDTPPISVAADAAVVGRLSDGVILVARPEVLDKNSARITKDYIDQSGLKVLGLVVNGMIPENESNSYYYYSQYNYYTQNTNKKDTPIQDDQLIGKD
ncbi:MAG: polysaccharide biosynthesis tyrosine autokinase [Thermosynechococcaceae cyanobacterium]